MLIITEDAGVFCKHGPGKVSNKPSQDWLTIVGRRILVEIDPEGRPISGCPSTVPFKPCLVTLKVITGYSDFIRADGRRVCLQSVTGFTDGTPPGVVKYEVRSAGQDFVSEIG
jgi:hypothetical protein